MSKRILTAYRVRELVAVLAKVDELYVYNTSMHGPNYVFVLDEADVRYLVELLEGIIDSPTEGTANEIPT